MNGFFKLEEQIVRPSGLHTTQLLHLENKTKKKHKKINFSGLITLRIYWC